MATISAVDPKVILIEKVDISKCKTLAEGKTKLIYELSENNNFVLVKSKDKITAFNAQRQNELEGKAELSNKATCRVFQYLDSVGLPSHFVKQLSDTEFLARKCAMIPIEWVARRIATGSFLKRNEGVSEGYRFSPLKLEMFFKDDALNDPQWSEETLISKKLIIGDRLIGRSEIEIMSRYTALIFEVLERAWAVQHCSLIDMKVEFGVVAETGEIVLADVIDNDSWRLWPSGDKRLQLDKQYYRDLPEVTNEALKKLKENFSLVVEMLGQFICSSKGRIVVISGSPSDKEHCRKIKLVCEQFGIRCFLRCCSAHKNTAEVLRIAAEYESDGIPTVFIAVAGLSNGLGPVLSGNVRSPVINCPPTNEKCSEDIWSSIRLPSGLHCSTVLSTTNAILNALSVLGISDHMLWSRLAVYQVCNAVNSINADRVIDNQQLNVGA